MKNALMFVALLLAASPVLGQDVVTIQSAIGEGPEIRVPIHLRDVSGTLLGSDAGAGMRIQGIGVNVTFSPAAAVSSATLERAGILESLTPAFENVASTSSSAGYVGLFTESSASIPLTLDAPAPGDHILDLVLTLSASGTPGTLINLTLTGTELTDETGQKVEYSGNAALSLVAGSATVVHPIPTVASISPTSGTTVGGTSFTISGGDFADGVSVSFGGATAYDIVRVSATTLTGRTPRHVSGTVDVVVSNPGDRSRTLPGAYEFRCVSAAQPALSGPSNGATGVSTSPLLRWGRDPGHFRYDLYLDTEPGASALLAANIAPNQAALVNSFSVSNLEPGTTYYWRIVAAGDPFCTGTETTSAVRSFTTAPACELPGSFALTFPTAGATGADPGLTLSWSAAAGSSSYDVFLGAVNPPPFAGSSTTTSFRPAGLQEGTTYYWSVVARGACELSTPTNVRSFTVTGSCLTPAPVSLQAPVDAAAGVVTDPRLLWGSATGASGYDLYFGTQNPPPLLMANLQTTGASLAGLDRGTTYYWRVVAKAECDEGPGAASPIRSFTTAAECDEPPAPAFNSAGSTVTAGQTYALSWSAGTTLSTDDHFVVERSSSASFSPLLDQRETGDPSATFVAGAGGTLYHRVRIVRGCSTPVNGPWSVAKALNVISAPPNVVFSRLPQPILASVGSVVNGLQGSFELENLSTTPLDVSIGVQELSSEPFFRVINPGGVAGTLTLEPGVPKALQIELFDIPENVAASYEGLIYVTSLDESLPVTPFALVSVRVGSSPLSTAVPQFRVGGVESSFAMFPPYDGEDDARSPITISIHNPGTEPMELAAEVGPEQWLLPMVGWNATPIPAGGTRQVQLRADRRRAPAGTPLPRQTYFTVRTQGGQSARLLVQDSGTFETGSGRFSALGSDEPSLILPDVLSLQGVDSPLVTALRLTNVGTDPLQANLFFTPEGADGFSTAVRRARVVIPASQGVTLLDPLVQLFGRSRPSRGQIEIRVNPAQFGQLQVRAEHVAAAEGLPVRGISPVVPRGEGARIGRPHVLGGVTRSSTMKTALVLAETGGIDGAAIRFSLVDADGNQLGTDLRQIARYGQLTIDDVVAELGLTAVQTGRIDLAVESGSGSVIAVARAGEIAGELMASTVSEPRPPLAGKGIAAQAEVTTTLVVPVVIQGPLSNSSNSYTTTTIFSNPLSSSASLKATLSSIAGSSFVKDLALSAGQTVEYGNVVSSLFQVNVNLVGKMEVTAPTGVTVASRLVSSAGTGTNQILELGSRFAAGANKPLQIDDLSHSVDPSRGTQWNLYVSETAGVGGTIEIRLYEHGLLHPEKRVEIPGFGQLPMESIFSFMGRADRDRGGVFVSVRALDDGMQITATALAVDNESGAAQVIALEPGSGVPSDLVTARPGAGRGDANGNGSIDVGDIFYLINSLFAGGPNAVASGDANCDGSVSVADIFYLINHLFAGGPPPCSGSLGSSVTAGAGAATVELGDAVTDGSELHIPVRVRTEGNVPVQALALTFEAGGADARFVSSGVGAEPLFEHSITSDGRLSHIMMLRAPLNSGTTVQLGELIVPRNSGGRTIALDPSRTFAGNREGTVQLRVKGERETPRPVRE